MITGTLLKMNCKAKVILHLCRLCPANQVAFLICTLLKQKVSGMIWKSRTEFADFEFVKTLGFKNYCRPGFFCDSMQQILRTLY